MLDYYYFFAKMGKGGEGLRRWDDVRGLAGGWKAGAGGDRR